MSRFKIYQDTCADVTVVSNLFIDEYMKDANDAQLKVYLYLLRMMNAGFATSVSDIADKFNHTEKDVIRALKYWEKNRLLALEYDDARNISGIRFLNVSKKTSSELVSLAPVVPLPAKTEGTVTAVSPASAAVASAAAPVASSSVSLTSAAGIASEDDRFAKPVYSLDQLKEFKNNEETSQIIFVAEQYIGKPLSPSEIKTILFFTDRLSFSEDLIDYLIQYCVDKGKKDFRYIEKVAINWAQEGITTPKQAARYASKYDKNVYEIMKALGKTGAPTKAEADFALKWIKEYGFTQDIITEACTRTVMATDSHRFEYADRILSNWYKNNVHRKNDIKVLDDAFAKSKSSFARPSAAGAGQFNQFMHNDYDFDALEKEIISN